MENVYLGRIRRMVLDFMAGEGARIYLFGSWAKGKQRRSSDVDIAVFYEGSSNSRKIAELRDFLEDSTIPYRVDVVDMSQASEALCREIRKDGILWTD